GTAHDRGSVDGSVFQPRPIERHVLGNAIEDRVVSAPLALDDFVHLDELSHHLLAACFLVHPLSECRRETAFHSKKDSDFFHSCFLGRDAALRCPSGYWSRTTQRAVPTTDLHAHHPQIFDKYEGSMSRQ